MQPSPLPKEFQAHAFRVRDARTAGIPAARLRRSDLPRPWHGMRTVRAAQADDTPSRCREILPIVPNEAIFSHATAALLHGLPVPSRLTDGRLHLAVPHPMRAPRRAGLVGHQLESIERFWLDVIPVPSPVEAWIQLGALLSLDEIVVAGDALCRRTDPLADPESLDRAVADAVGRPGIRRLRAALPQIRARTDSPMETVLRLAIIRAGLPEPHVNYRIQTPARPYHADLAYPDRRVAIEYDGDHHRTDARQFHADIDRISDIHAAGWRVLRLNRSHLLPSAMPALHRIRQTLTTSGHDTLDGSCF